MREIILTALLVLPALCHANSVQIATRTPSYTVSSPTAKSLLCQYGNEITSHLPQLQLGACPGNQV